MLTTPWSLVWWCNDEKTLIHALKWINAQLQTKSNIKKENMDNFLMIICYYIRTNSDHFKILILVDTDRYRSFFIAMSCESKGSCTQREHKGSGWGWMWKVAVCHSFYTSLFWSALTSTLNVIACANGPQTQTATASCVTRVSFSETRMAGRSMLLLLLCNRKALYHMVWYSSRGTSPNLQ